MSLRAVVSLSVALVAPSAALAQSRPAMGLAPAPQPVAPVTVLPLFPVARVAVPFVSYGYGYAYNAGHSYAYTRPLAIQSASRAPYIVGPGAFQPDGVGSGSGARWGWSRTDVSEIVKLAGTSK